MPAFKGARLLARWLKAVQDRRPQQQWSSLPVIKGGGHKQHYRVVDFRRNKDGIVAKVERIEYDPNRSGQYRAAVLRRWRTSLHHRPEGLVVGQTVVSGSEAPIKAGNALPIRNIPVGSTLHCVEMIRAKGARARSRCGSCSCWLVKAFTPRFVCAPAKSAGCISNAAPPSVKSATKSIAAQDRQGRCKPLAWYPSDGSWHRDEPGGSPARWW